MAYTDITQKNLNDGFLSLPPLVRERLSSAQTAETINDINENAGIYSSDRRRVVPVIIFRLVTKDIEPMQVMQALVSELGIKPEDAKRLTEEVVERVFAPIKQSLGELGIDVEKIKSGNAQAAPPIVTGEKAVEMTAPVTSGMPLRDSSPKFDEIAAKYDSTRPENDKLAPSNDMAAIAEMQKKRMATPFDVGGQISFSPRPSTGALPPRETKVDMGAMPTLKEEGDRVKFKEAVPSSSASPAAPFILHQESELMPVQTPKTFHSNTEANYPRPTPAPSIPVRVEIGKSSEEKTVFGPSRFAPSFTPATTPSPTRAPAPASLPSKSQVITPPILNSGEFASLASRNNRAERANESFRKSSLPPMPMPKAEPKVEGNTLDLRSQG